MIWLKGLKVLVIKVMNNVSLAVILLGIAITDLNVFFIAVCIYASMIAFVYLLHTITYVIAHAIFRAKSKSRE